MRARSAAAPARRGGGPGVVFRPVEAGGVSLVVARPTPPRRRLPLVLLLPGLGQPPGDLFPWMYTLARGGAAAATLEQAVPLGAGGDLVEQVEGWLQEVLRRAERALASLARAGGPEAGPVGVAGISAGGWAALRLAERSGPAGDGRLQVEAVAAVLSGPGWRRVPQGAPELLAQAGLRLRDGCAGLPVDPRRAPLLHPGDEAARAERLGKCAVLLVGAGQDPVVDLDLLRSFYDALAARRREAGERLQLVVYPSLGHRITPPMAARVCSWLLWMLGAGAVRA
ncbi:MAG TPA: hypothetical protein VIK90_05165 [Limnochordales bacterium]